jgi:hypothetical protein
MTRHPTDYLSLAFGLAFVACGLVLLSGGSGALSLEWVGPMAAIGIGALLLLAGRQGRTAEDEPAAQPPAE